MLFDNEKALRNMREITLTTILTWGQYGFIFVLCDVGLKSHFQIL